MDPDQEEITDFNSFGGSRKIKIDGHIHIGKGPYTIDWIQEFVQQAEKADLTEIRLLEHNYMFPEFSPMYDSVRAASGLDFGFNAKPPFLR